MLKIGTGVVSGAVFVAATLLLWPREGPDNLMTRPSEDEHRLGEAVGWVSKVEAGTSTIHVSPTPRGLGGVPLVVTPDTTVAVGDQKGTFGDLQEGSPVRVTYEFRQGTSLARSVQVLLEDKQQRANVDPRRSGATRPPGEPASMKNSIGAGPRQEVHPPVVLEPEPGESATPARPAAASTPKQVSSPRKARAHDTTESRDPEQPQESARSQDGAQSQDTDAQDPSRVIDWLLKDGRR